mmetsp:Transcript_43618/g.108876  ORF Transcript_43618/g.108876 Transcript_43618/m.108876 type:complete len:233 (-) Transcript_43618:250-948(-)
MPLSGRAPTCSSMPSTANIASRPCLISASAQSSRIPSSASPSGSKPRSPGTLENMPLFSITTSLPNDANCGRADPARNRVLPVCTSSRSFSDMSVIRIFMLGSHRNLAVLSSIRAMAIRICIRPAGGIAKSALNGFISLKAGTNSSPSKPAGFCTSSGANRPTAANMHSRPCFSSALRRKPTSAILLKPSGSNPKSPTSVPSPICGLATQGRARDTSDGTRICGTSSLSHTF